MAAIGHQKFQAHTRSSQHLQAQPSYGPSFAQTYMSVSEAAPTASPYPEIVFPPTETYIIGVGVAIIIAIAIGFAVTILVLRKRP